MPALVPLYCVGGFMYQIRKIYIEIAYQCLNSILFTRSASGVYATSRLQYLSGHKDDSDDVPTEKKKTKPPAVSCYVIVPVKAKPTLFQLYVLGMRIFLCHKQTNSSCT